MKLSKAAKTYLKDVRKKLPIMDSSARKMLRELKTSVAEFSAERPKANIEDFEKRFGSSYNILESYVSQFCNNYVRNYIISHRLKIAILSVLSAILFFVGSVALIIYINTSWEPPVYIVTTTEETVETEIQTDADTEERNNEN